jgi:hypothetical protein
LLETLRKDCKSHIFFDPKSVFQYTIYFLAMLDLSNLSILVNDPIQHQTLCPKIPTKFPSDIPKFDGKPREDLSTHVMMYHLWCSSNSLVGDSIQLRIFQRTLTGSATKWYIELLGATYHMFASFSMNFLMHFQLLRFRHHSVRTLSCTFPIILMNGYDGLGSVKIKF